MQIVGLIFDVAGVFVLGIAPALASVGHIAKLSGSYWDANVELARSLSQGAC